jgi:hypothetical protein
MIEAGELLAALGHSSRARQEYRRYLEAHPGDGDVILHYARMEYNEGNCDSVVNILQMLPQSWSRKQETESLRAQCRRDTIAPVITLIGNNPVVLTRNEPFDDPGASAVDAVDGEIGDRIETSGTVESGREGTYQIVYAVQDNAGNTNSVTREVIVSEHPELVPGYARHAPRKPAFFIKSRPRNILSLSSGIIAAGAIIGGAVMNYQLNALYSRYSESRDSVEVYSLHDRLSGTSMLRNVLYAAGGAAALGLTINIAIPGRRQRN